MLMSRGIHKRASRKRSNLIVPSSGRPSHEKKEIDLMPDIERGERRAQFIAALAVSCPYCKAREHNDCQTVRGGNWTVWPPHKTRIDAAKVAPNASSSPTDRGSE